MLSLRKTRLAWLGLGVAVCCLAGTASAAPASGKAAEPGPDTRWIASDSEMVLTVNIRQILNSAAVKKGGLEGLKAEIKKGGKFFEAAGLDPLRDLDSLTLSAGGPAKEAKVQMVLRGRFDPAKFKAAAQRLARDKPEELKVSDEGKTTLYQIKMPEPPGVPLPPGAAGFDKPLFGAFADNNTFVLTPSKEGTLEALKGVGKKPRLGKDLNSALAKFTGRESMALAVVVTDEMKKALGKLPRTGAIAPKLQTLTAELLLTDAAQFNLQINAEDADTAKEVLDLVKTGLGVAKAFLGMSEEVPPVVGDLLDAIKTTREKNSVVVSIKVTEKMLEKAGKGDKDK
jgi:hypothetical protein